jgi:hypothetical protein
MNVVKNCGSHSVVLVAMSYLRHMPGILETLQVISRVRETVYHLIRLLFDRFEIRETKSTTKDTFGDWLEAPGEIGKYWVVAVTLFHSASPQVNLDSEISSLDEDPKHQFEGAMFICEPAVATNQNPEVCFIGNVTKGRSNGFCNATLEIQRS